MASLDEQLTAYLSDAHALEQQALPQMRAAPDMAGDPELAAAFRAHLAETERHEQLTRERLEARGGSTSKVKEAIFKAGGLGFVLFAKTQPDTPGKLLAHAVSYEHLELAAYDLLLRVADRAGDAETAAIARTIREDERSMSDRLEASYDRALDASDTRDLDKYLADAHAIEAQSIGLLEKGPALAGSGELARVYSEHLEQSRGHQRLIAERLEARGSSPSALKDAAMRLGALNWGGFFAAQPDTPAKLAAFAYAFEFLETAGYELLERVARREGDAETATLAERIIADERGMARRLSEHFDAALDASLEAQEVHA